MKWTNRILGGIAVAGAAVAVVYLTNKGHSVDHGVVTDHLPKNTHTGPQQVMPVTPGNKVEHAQQVMPAPSGHKAKEAHDAAQSAGSQSGAAAGSEVHTQAAETVRLKRGQTIWGIATEQLQQNGNRNPSNQEILTRTQHLLNLNHLNWEQARQLAEDSEIKLS
jgi:hypothetical protein